MVGLGLLRPLGHGVAACTSTPEDEHILGRAMSDEQPSAPNHPSGSAPLSREQRMQLLHDELIKLNAQLEYLRLMLRLRAPKA